MGCNKYGIEHLVRLKIHFSSKKCVEFAEQCTRERRGYFAFFSILWITSISSFWKTNESTLIAATYKIRKK